MAKKAKESVAVLEPRNLEEANAWIGRIWEERRAINEINADLDEKIAELTTAATAKAQSHQIQFMELFAGLFRFANENRKTLELTDKGERKSCKLPSGTFGWRWSPPYLDITGNKKEAVQRLKDAGFPRFVCKVEEPDKDEIKQALIKDKEKGGDLAEKLKGFRVKQDESFFVKSDAAQAEIEEGADKLRKAIAS